MMVLFNEMKKNEDYTFTNYKSTLLQNLADLSSKSGKKNLALNYAKELIKLNQSNDKTSGVAYLIISKTYLKSNEFDKAEFFIKEGIKDIEKYKDKIQAYHEMINILKERLIELHYKKGEYELALVEANKALFELSKFKFLNLSNLYIWLSKVHFALGNLDKSYKYLKIVDNEINNNSNGYTFLSKAEIKLLEGNIKSSLKDHYNSFQSYKSVLNILNEGKTVGLLDTNNTIFMSSYVPALTGVIQTLDAVDKEEDYKKYIPKIISVLDNFRSLYSDEQDKYILTKNLYKAIEVCLEFISKQEIQDVQMAYELMERAKSLNLFDSYNAANLVSYKTKDQLLIKEEKLQHELNVLSQKMQEQKGILQNEDFFFSQISSRYIIVNRELDSIKNLIRAIKPDYYKLKYTPSLTTLREIQEILPNNKIILQYLTGENNTFLITISREKAQIKKLTLNTIELTEKCNQYLSYLLLPLNPSTNSYRQNINNYTSISHELYNILIDKKAISNPKVSHVIIAADGVLNDLPFETLLTSLPNNPTSFQKLPYFINEFAVSYIFSGTLYKKMKENSTKKRGKILAFAPDFDMEFNAPGYLSPIMNNKEEIKYISKLAKTKMLIGKTSNKKSFLKYVNDYSVLHFATHGFSDNTQSNSSYISFSQYGNEINPQEMLYIRDLYNYRINAEMVVLSACETNLGQYFRGEGIYSLARSFVYAGSHSVITSLWKVNQRSAAKTMEGFYKNLKYGMNKAEAMQKTKMDIIKKDGIMAHPYYWAGFVVLGNEDALLLAKPSLLELYQKILIIIGIIVFSVFIFYRFQGKKSKMT
jgi:CHAT domain-containing protein